MDTTDVMSSPYLFVVHLYADVDDSYNRIAPSSVHLAAFLWLLRSMLSA